MSHSRFVEGDEVAAGLSAISPSRPAWVHDAFKMPVIRPSVILTSR
jgi:hypothetical protein